MIIPSKILKILIVFYTNKIMPAKKIASKYERVINEFIEKLKKKFGKRLVSVVLFGSVARGTATKYSDIDLLVVVNRLPEYKKRANLIFKITHELMLKNRIKISPILLTPKEVNYSFKSYFPLFSGIALGYNVIYDKQDYTIKFKDFENNLRAHGNYEHGVWSIPKIAIKER